MENMESSKGEIVMYQPDETIRLEVRVENETVWLTQAQMAELFRTTKQNVSLHVNNIFREDELVESSVVKDSLTTARDGKRYKTKMYNLDVIISVGYRVKSKRGTQFRQWARNSLPISKCGKHHQQTSSTGYDEPMHKTRPPICQLWHEGWLLVRKYLKSSEDFLFFRLLFVYSYCSMGFRTKELGILFIHLLF